MIVRRYKLGEEPEIWNIYFRATHESNARDYHPDLLHRWACPDQDMNLWRDRLANTNPFVAVADGTIVGMAELEEDGAIGYFYVLPNYQAQGIGSSLLRAIEREAERVGLFVLTADVSITAKDFFVARGFQIKEARNNVIIGHPAPNFATFKELKKANKATPRKPSD